MRNSNFHIQSLSLLKNWITSWISCPLVFLVDFKSKCTTSKTLICISKSVFPYSQLQITLMKTQTSNSSKSQFRKMRLVTWFWGLPDNHRIFYFFGSPRTTISNKYLVCFLRATFAYSDKMRSITPSSVQ